MQLVELILIAVGLSFDTFAVSVSSGLAVSKIKFFQGVRIALVLAVFQTMMPFMGWLGGVQIEQYLNNYDHWIAFGLLTILGVKMLIEAFKPDEDKNFNPLLFKVLVGMAVATSIDAFVVGISFAFFKINIYLTLFIIGSITFLASMVGMLLGKKIGNKFGNKAEIAGGIILIGIGLKILLSHIYN